MINRYTVIGQPIAQSVSPAIHHMFGELTQRRLQYTRTEATRDTFAVTVKQWQSNGGNGCNVTAPFKELAANLCDQLDKSAELAGAVNTIEMRNDGLLVGHNTDGIGLVTDIQENKHVQLAGTRILMVGAGGAARGAMGPLLSANPKCLHIANRTVERAEQLANSFDKFGPVEFGNYDNLRHVASFDVIINATSMGFDNSAPALPNNIIQTNTFAYDMMYKAVQTPFLAWCEQNGVSHFSDGFGMLVEQAADAYQIWEGVRPDTRTVHLAINDIIKSANV